MAITSATCQMWCGRVASFLGAGSPATCETVSITEGRGVLPAPSPPPPPAPPHRLAAGLDAAMEAVPQELEVEQFLNQAYKRDNIPNTKDGTLM